MVKEIHFNGAKIQYDLQYKKVKNINLRISSDGKVSVSANRRVSQRTIDEFLISKAEVIIRAVERCKITASVPATQYFSEDEVCRIVTELCDTAYPYYEKRGIKRPQLKFRKMVSRWGSCHPTKGILTFNKNLMYAPIECIEYVVLHEFTHFLQANHSPKFYEELERVCLDWKARKKKLKDVYIQKQ